MVAVISFAFSLLRLRDHRAKLLPTAQHVWRNHNKTSTFQLNAALHNDDRVYGAKKIYLVVSYSQSIFLAYLCIWMQKNLIFDSKMIQKQ